MLFQSTDGLLVLGSSYVIKDGPAVGVEDLINFALENVGSVQSRAPLCLLQLTSEKISPSTGEVSSTPNFGIEPRLASRQA